MEAIRAGPVAAMAQPPPAYRAQGAFWPVLAFLERFGAVPLLTAMGGARPFRECRVLRRPHSEPSAASGWGSALRLPAPQAPIRAQEGQPHRRTHWGWCSACGLSALNGGNRAQDVVTPISRSSRPVGLPRARWWRKTRGKRRPRPPPSDASAEGGGKGNQESGADRGASRTPASNAIPGAGAEPKATQQLQEESWWVLPWVDNCIARLTPVPSRLVRSAQGGTYEKAFGDRLYRSHEGLPWFVGVSPRLAKQAGMRS